MKVVSLWSGGKDSCFACYKAKQQGYKISALFNFLASDGKKSLSHGLRADLILEQMRLTGIPYFQKAMPKETYRDNFKKLIEKWKSDIGIEGIVFGDIYLQAHKDWIDEVCKETDVKPVMPLWGTATDKIIDEFVSAGFKSVIVAVKENALSREWLGRVIDENFRKQLDAKIDPCGEEGEFHTFVLSGPLFGKSLEITKGGQVLINGSWYLEIPKWRVLNEN